MTTQPLFAKPQQELTARQTNAELAALKDTIRTRHDVVRKDVGAIAKEYQKTLTYQTTAEPGTARYYIDRTVQWLGLGPAYQQRRLVQHMRRTAAQLGAVTQNLREECEQYAMQRRDLLSTIAQDQQLFVINKGLADNLYQSVQEARAQLETLKQATPFADATSAETLLLENRILDYETDMDKLDLEQDEIVMRLEGSLDKREMCMAGYQLATSMLSEFSRQQVGFGIHLDRAEYASRVRKGTGVKDIMQTYTAAAALVDKLAHTTNSLATNPFAKLPRELRITAGGGQAATPPQAAVPYWRAHYSRVLDRLEHLRQ